MLPKGLLKEYSRPLEILLRGLILLSICCAGWLAYYFKFKHILFPFSYAAALVTGALLTLLIFPFFNIYASIRGREFTGYLANLIQAFMVWILLLSGAAFFTKTGDYFSREWFVLWIFFSFSAILFLRFSLLSMLRLMRTQGWNERRVVIVGAGMLGSQLAETMQQALWTGFHIVAFFDDEASEKPAFIHHIPVLNTPKQMDLYLTDQQIDEIWLALPLQAEARVREILHELRYLTVTTRFVLDLFGLDLLNHSISDLAGFSVLNIRSSPMMGMNRIIKGLEDRFFAALILLLMSPLLALIALIIKLDSRGPVFYRQKRIGWNGKPFDMLKFRTMPVNIESETGPVWAKSNENRATRIGSFLRHSSLDELPQFFNVLKGDMSIVGPRPERPFFVDQFKEKIPRYMQKHYMKAGITGWAQINGWRGNTSLEKRIEYDLYYIENWTLSFDLKIILLTFFRGFINRNAY